MDTGGFDAIYHTFVLAQQFLLPLLCCTNLQFLMFAVFTFHLDSSPF